MPSSSSSDMNYSWDVPSDEDIFQTSVRRIFRVPIFLKKGIARTKRIARSEFLGFKTSNPQ
jgi:hypothetical protein